MKKSLIALAVMGASTVAFAASNVTLYGVIDTGVAVTKVKHQDTKVQMSTGWDSGSRWGIRGVEELGNGYTVGFQLEQGFRSDDGSVSNGSNGTTSGFTREAQLNIKGAFGTLAAGRFGTLGSGAGSYTILQGWAFGTSYEDQGSWTKFGKGWGRTNNNLVYVSPSFSGFTVHAMYSNGVTTDDNKWSDNRHYYGLGLKYAGAAANASLIFEAVDGKGTGGEKELLAGVNGILSTLGFDNVKEKDLSDLGLNPKAKVKMDDYKTAYGITAGGSYKFGVLTGYGIYQYAWQSDMYSQHAFGLGLGADIGGGTAKFGARYLLGKLDGDMKTAAKWAGIDTKYRALNIDAGYTYPLSKRTYVYAFAGWSDGAKLYKNVEKGQWNGWSIASGLVHKF